MADDAREYGLVGNCFSFLKGAEDIIAPKDGKRFEWELASTKVREHLSDAMNAKNIAFLLGSGCSSYMKNGHQVGIHTMKPMAEAFIHAVGVGNDDQLITEYERHILKDRLGLDVGDVEYTQNL